MSSRVRGSASARLMGRVLRPRYWGLREAGGGQREGHGGGCGGTHGVLTWEGCQVWTWEE